MNVSIYIKYSLVALLLWSAIFLCGCSDKVNSNVVLDDESKLATLSADSLTVISYIDGNIQYRFVTPLMNRYEFATEPYMEFPKGIYIITFDDSTKREVSSLVADYAIYYETRRLWEAKGNVIAKDSLTKELTTQQLFWDEEKRKIYSNVDTKIDDNGDITFGTGFESDDALANVNIFRSRGRFLVDTVMMQNRDSVIMVPSDTIKVESKE